MATKKKLNIRKQGKQSRSKETVEIILEAATRILEKVGLEKTTTNKISELAGVSVGSYYQYFPNKESLVGKMIERELEKNTKKLEEIFSQNNSPENAIESAIDLLANQFFKKHRIAKVLISELSSLKKTEVQLEARRRTATVIEQFLKEHRKEIKNPKIKSYVLVNAVMGVFYTAILDESYQENQEALKQELVILINSYLSVEE